MYGSQKTYSPHSKRATASTFAAYTLYPSPPFFYHPLTYLFSISEVWTLAKKFCEKEDGRKGFLMFYKWKNLKPVKWSHSAVISWLKPEMNFLLWTGKNVRIKGAGSSVFLWYPQPNELLLLHFDSRIKLAFSLKNAGFCFLKFSFKSGSTFSYAFVRISCLNLSFAVHMSAVLSAPCPIECSSAFGFWNELTIMLIAYLRGCSNWPAKANGWFKYLFCEELEFTLERKEIGLN